MNENEDAAHVVACWNAFEPGGAVRELIQEAENALRSLDYIRTEGQMLADAQDEADSMWPKLDAALAPFRGPK